MEKRKETDIEIEVNKFLRNHPKFSADSARKFADKYYDSKSEGKLGSKFSERIFVKWILNALEGEIDRNNIKTHFPFSLMLDGKEITDGKKADLYIKRGDTEVLIEFKCNIDNIEKDLFKFVFSDKKYKKILFIWEGWDKSENQNGEDSSYLKILKAFENPPYKIDYVYLPVYEKNKRELTLDLEKRFKELINKILG
jgi:hypothetical protein